MTTENKITTPKFADEATGRDACNLDCTISPVYYGFNCYPRQVKYYRLDKSVESVLNGGFTRSSVEKYLGKIKEKMSKSELKHAEYDAKVKALRVKQDACTDYQTRQILRKEGAKVETRMYNYEYETLGKYRNAVEKLTKFLAE